MRQIFFACILLLGLSMLPLMAQKSDPLQEQLFRDFEKNMEQASREGIPLYAPSFYGRAYEAYLKAQERFRRGDKLKNIREDLDVAARLLKEAVAAAKISQAALSGVAASREQILNSKINVMMPDDFEKTERLFSRMVQEAEAGNVRQARDKIPELEKKYRELVLDAYQKNILKEADKNLQKRRRTMSDRDLQTARSRLAQIKDQVKAAERQPFGIAEMVNDLNGKIAEALEFIYPAWYRNLPDTLKMGSFTLHVLSWSSRGAYDFDADVATGLAGEAEVAFSCGYTLLSPVGLGTILQNFYVVSTVVNAEKEISLVDAQKVNPKIKAGQEVALPLRSKSAGKADLLAAKADFFKHLIPNTSASRGRIRLSFKEVTITPVPRTTLATITAGEAWYPTRIPDPPRPAEIHTAGFTILADSLHFTPGGATAMARLRLPASLVDANGCDPALLNLGQVAITADCQLYKSLPDSSFGPFRMDPTGMVFHGDKGYTVDLSTSTSPPGLGLTAEWRGVVLNSGKTLFAAPGTLISNTGYLQAAYQFSNARVTSTGLAGRFTTSSSFTFSSLQPFGYDITLGSGYLDIDSTRVQGGQFTSGTLQLPVHAVCKGSVGTPLRATFSTMTVQSDMDLTAQVKIDGTLSWGELTRSGEEIISYSATPNMAHPNSTLFYLCARANTSYLPGSTADFDIGWSADPFATLEEKQIAGVTLLALKEYAIWTPDIPGSPPKRITFVEGSGVVFIATWLNVDYGGVNGRIIMMPPDKKDVELGDPAVTWYKGGTPFKASLECRSQKKEKCLFVAYSSSAVFDSEFNGILDITGPSAVQLPFKDLEFTSTAHIVGGDIDLSTPVTLDYWGVQLVSTSPGVPAGVLSVKSGQIIFTHAGIREKRHFAAPFKLYWAEMLADGNIGELFFDYNSANQKFDGFNFTPEYVALSRYDSGKPGYLQACGDVHFNFFGSNYLSIQDAKYTGSDAIGIYGGRSVTLLNSAITGCDASDMTLKKTWSTLADFEYTLTYDSNDQDGFIGEGSATMSDHFGRELRSSLQIDSTQIQASLAIDSGTNFILADRDFGSAAELWGCITITGNTLSCITLGFTLEATSQSAFGIWGGEGAMIEVKEVIKPTFTSFSAAGKMYVDFALGGGTMGIDGAILLTMDTQTNTVTGDLQGKMDFTSLFAGLKASGHVNWKLSPLTQYIQGRAAIEVFSRKFSAGVAGGIFLGNNVPNGECWVLLDPSNRYSVAMDKLPAYITGVYGYGSVDFSLNFGVFSGGIGIYAGVGAFVNLIGVTPQVGVPLPYMLTNLGVSLHGEILWGLVSASAWVNLQMSLGVPTYFQGTAGLEGCVLWVICGSVDVTVRLSDDGFEIF